MKNKMMVLLAGAFVLVSGSAFADGTVRGYVKKDGTYVAPHVRTSPNSTKLDNYSTKGNYNPYSGKTGTKDPYKAPKNPK